MRFLRRFWFLAVLLLVLGSFLQVQRGEILGISVQTIGFICLLLSALWVLAILVHWAYRNAMA